MLEIKRGGSPLVLGLPHTGTSLPDDIADGLNDTGRALADTDWHIHRLYADLIGDITTIRTRIHRYAIDVNRDPSGESLYPGQNTTTLCPLTDFDGHPLYRSGHEPDDAEIARRRETYHAPYHAALRAELDRVKAQYGFAILYDCHSIRSHIPFLFDGRLPDFNIGTNNGTTCAPEIESAVARICAAAPGRTAVLNGRFKGGWTTRHYGRAEDGVHVIQMELAQSAYLSDEAPPWSYDDTKADRLRTHLKTILETLIRWRPA
ncbi:N-formylglutamate deformylase [Marimonas arenosa]|uniref:N-formylglutamate deformylase n=1 Tax=Marimonas arenosa TaxID=1795305 RepID=A0AAE4B5G4_9RHOB|nr:N-formylglutamate deformylase [Marimonas arenosa]MDQ2091132.1 N-formylglutamate deformylase [Marimonas arenosa]